MSPSVRDDHAREEERADDDVLVLGGHEIGRQRGLERAEHRHGKDDSENRAATTEDRDAAEQYDRDDVELDPDPGVVAGGCEAERPEHAGEPAQHPREDVQPELDPLDADPRKECRLLVCTDREDRTTERRRVENHGEDDG